MTLSGIVTDARLVQEENASRTNTCDAIWNSDRCQASAGLNALSPILVTLSGIVTDARLVQEEQCNTPILVTLSGNSDRCQAIAGIECISHQYL